MNPITLAAFGACWTVAAAIAARTHRIKIGTAVQILPPSAIPLRLAEETATIDQISGGRLIFGVGRSAFPRAYNAYGISYEESPQRFSECLEIVKKAWTQENASHQAAAGTASRISRWCAASGAAAAPGNPHRREPAQHLFGDRRARLPAVLRGAREPLVRARRTHARLPRGVGGGPPPPAKPCDPVLQVPIYVGATREAALADAEAGMMRFSTYRPDLVRGPMNYETVRREKGIVGTPEMVVERLMELRDTAELAGVSAEINPGSMLSHEQVMASLRLLYIQEVMPHFK